MKKQLQLIVIALLAMLLLGACQQIDAISQTADFSQIENAEFYGQLQATISQLQIPVIIVGLISLLVGWKLGRFGLALNACVIGGLMLYTFLADGAWISDANWQLGLSIAGAVIIGVLAYFLYNLMALIIGGAIGSTLMNGAWLQVADNVPPQLLVFVTTFVSALVMFLVFRLFLVAFSAVIGAAILMLAVPYPTLWAIPVAIVGTVIQIVLALMLKDDIFKNIRGDFGAAFGQAFGEMLGPLGTLRDYQKGSKEQQSPASAKAQPKAKPEPKPEPKAPAPQQSAQPYSYGGSAQPPQQYQAPKPAAPQQYQAPKPAAPQQPAQPYSYGGSAQAPKPAAPQQPYQLPQQYQAPKPAATQQPAQPYSYGGSVQAPKPAAPQPSYQPQQPFQAPQNPTPPAANPAPIPPTQPNIVFRPEQYAIVLSTGQSYPLAGTQVTVGRNPDNTIVLDDPQVSGYHLMLSIQTEGLVAWDNNSTNGTYYNGQLLTGSVRLTTNDVLQVGAVSLRLVRIAFE